MLRRVLILVMLASPVLAQRGSKTLQVFLFAGQSNMVGADTDPARVDDYPPFVGAAEPQKDVRYAYAVGDQASEGWTHLAPVGGDFGPELTFAREVKQWIDQPIAIIKCAVGGTTIALDWHPGSPAEGRKLFERAITLTKQSLAELERKKQRYELAGLFWHQGENDMLSGEHRAHYENGLKLFLERLRAELDAPNLPVFIGEFSDKGIWGMDHREPMRSLRTQQRAVVDDDPNAYFVPTSHLAFEVMQSGQPHYHFGTLGQLQHGRAYAHAWLRTVDRLKAEKPPELRKLPAGRDGSVRVFLLLGQRNVAGDSSFVAELPRTLRRPQARVAFRALLGGGVYESQNWEPLRALDPLSRFGPELTLGQKLEKKLGDGVAVLKISDSAAQISDWLPDGQAASRPLHAHSLDFVRRALEDLESRGLQPRVEAVFWHHGENETYYTPFRKLYHERLREVIAAWRRDLGIPELPWFAALQSERAPWGAEAIAEMNAGLLALAEADPNLFALSTSDLSHGRIHFDANGIQRLGERFAQSYLEQR